MYIFLHKQWSSLFSAFSIFVLWMKSHPEYPSPWHPRCFHLWSQRTTPRELLANTPGPMHLSSVPVYRGPAPPAPLLWSLVQGARIPSVESLLTSPPPPLFLKAPNQTKPYLGAPLHWSQSTSRIKSGFRPPIIVIITRKQSYMEKVTGKSSRKSRTHSDQGWQIQTDYATVIL